MVVRLLIILLGIISVPVFAGSDAAEAGFWHGFMHTLIGLDHLLVALSVGMLCAMLSQGVVCFIPLAFLFFMTLGGIAGMLQISLPFVSFAVAVSVIAVGILIALNRKFPLSFVMAFVGILAVFHGHAHGTEMPNMEHYVAYGLGFLTGTALLQVVGMLLGAGLNYLDRNSRLLRYAGGAIAVVGSYMVVALML